MVKHVLTQRFEKGPFKQQRKFNIQNRIRVIASQAWSSG